MKISQLHVTFLGYKVLYFDDQFTKYSLDPYHTTELSHVRSPTGIVSHFFNTKIITPR